jgi:hypothetical protein
MKGTVKTNRPDFFGEGIKIDIYEKIIFELEDVLFPSWFSGRSAWTSGG